MTTETAPDTTPKQAWLPPRWFIRSAWVVHRAIYNVTGGNRGLKVPTETQWGMMRLHSTGRRSGAERLAILAYFEEGPNLVTLAMNGWGAPEPAWWLNLQAKPECDGRPEGRRVPSHPCPTGHGRRASAALGAMGSLQRREHGGLGRPARRRRPPSSSWSRRSDPGAPSGSPRLASYVHSLGATPRTKRDASSAASPLESPVSAVSSRHAQNPTT